MPTQNTKFVMSKAQPTGLFRPQIPIPSQKSQATLTPSRLSMARDTPKHSHHARGVFDSSGAATASVMEWKSGPPRIRGGRWVSSSCTSEKRFPGKQLRPNGG